MVTIASASRAMADRRTAVAAGSLRSCRSPEGHSLLIEDLEAANLDQRLRDKPEKNPIGCWTSNGFQIRRHSSVCQALEDIREMAVVRGGSLTCIRPRLVARAIPDRERLTIAEAALEALDHGEVIFGCAKTGISLRPEARRHRRIPGRTAEHAQLQASERALITAGGRR